MPQPVRAFADSTGRAWLVLDNGQRIELPAGYGGGSNGGGTSLDEVWVGTEPPLDPAIELWVDTDAEVAPPPEIPGPPVWTPYVPVLTNWTASSLVANYVRDGDTVTVSVKATVATVTGLITIEPPLQIHAENTATAVATARCVCAGSLWYMHASAAGSSAIYIQYSSAAAGTGTSTSATAPGVWRAGDLVAFVLTYRTTGVLL